MKQLTDEKTITALSWSLESVESRKRNSGGYVEAQAVLRVLRKRVALAAKQAVPAPAPANTPACIGCGTTIDVKRDDVYSYYRCPNEDCRIF